MEVLRSSDSPPSGTTKWRWVSGGTILTGENRKHFEEDLFQYHSVQHTPHMDWAGFEYGRQRNSSQSQPTSQVSPYKHSVYIVRDEGFVMFQ